MRIFNDGKAVAKRIGDCGNPYTFADIGDRFQQRAFELLTSSNTQQAFQIDREDPRTRDRYGRNIYGQSVLMARRLIEAGTRVVTISWAPDANATWDTHGNNFKSLKEKLLPQLDDALSSLLADLANRLNAKVNLIPYNRVEDLTWERPSEAVQEAFLAALEEHRVVATLRREKGHDIAAACGQLRLQRERAERVVAPAAA